MPRTHRPYPPEFRAEAVRLARDGDRALPALAADLGTSSEALRQWLRQADADAGQGPPGALSGTEQEELRRLRRENHVLKQERAIVKKAAACCARETLCATTGSSRGRRPHSPSPPCVACSRWVARATRRGRGAGSRPAPRPTRR